MKVRQNGLDIFFITLCLAVSAAGGLIASNPAMAGTASGDDVVQVAASGEIAPN